MIASLPSRSGSRRRNVAEPVLQVIDHFGERCEILGEDLTLSFSQPETSRRLRSWLLVHAEKSTVGGPAAPCGGHAVAVQ